MSTLKKFGIILIQGVLEVSLMLCFLVITSIFLFQERICKRVVAEITKDMRKPISYSTLDLTAWSTFPNVSINVHDVVAKDAFKNNNSDQILFKAKTFSIHLNPFDLLKSVKEVKALELNNGEINLRTDKTGDVNYMVFKESNTKDTKDPLHVKLKQISVNNVHVNYLNDQSNKRLSTQLKAMQFSGDFNNHQYALASKGDFILTQYTSGNVKLIKNKAINIDLTLKVDMDHQSYILPKSSILVEKLPFYCEGMYTKDTVYFSLNSQNLALNDVVNKLSLDKAKTELDRYKGGGKVKFDALIHGKTGEDSPTYVACDFSIQDGFLTEPIKNTSIDNINLSGSYKSNGNSFQDELLFPILSFNTSSGPFKAKLKVNNFIHPSIVGNASGNVNLKAANMLFNVTQIESIMGQANVNADFDLSVRDNVEVNDFGGTLNLNNVNLKLKGDQRNFSNLNAFITLHGDEMHVAKGHVNLNKSDIQLEGQAKNIFNYLASKGSLNINADLTSNTIRVEDLGATTKQEKKSTEGKQFVLPNDLMGGLTLRVNQLQYDGHRFENINTQLNIENRRLSFPHLSLRNADADMSGSLSIKEQAPERFDLSLNGVSENIHFAPLFKEWNNFDQTVINSDQISGNARVEVSLEAPFDLLSGIQLNQVAAKVHMRVQDGKLNNISSLNDVANSINTNAGRLVLGKKNIAAFQNKLSTIQFETLENTLIIRNNAVEIPNMEIASSAIDMKLSGKHTFDNMIDYRIGFNFRELVAEDRDAAYGKVIDDENGLAVFLRMYGSVDNPQIIWDKSARKEQLKEDIQEEKQTIKAIIKSEFGGFSKDSTIEEYRPKESKKEIVKLNFNPNQNKPSVPASHPSVATAESERSKKEGGKLKKTLNQWKEEQPQQSVKVTIKKG